MRCPHNNVREARPDELTLEETRRVVEAASTESGLLTTTFIERCLRDGAMEKVGFCEQCGQVTYMFDRDKAIEVARQLNEEG